MTELELKFRVDDEALRRWRMLLLQQGAHQQRLRAHYFDTADGRLDRARISLRLRHEGGGWVQTLKTAGDGAIVRHEHEVPLPGFAPEQPPPLDLRRHAGSAAFGPLAAALDGDADASRLAVRHAAIVARTALRVRTAAGTEAELALDEGEVLAGGRRSSIGELEIEHLGGPVDGLFDIAHDVLAAGGAWLGTVSKAERGARLLATTAPRAVKAAPMALPLPCDGHAFVRQVLRNTLGQVLPNLGEVAEGDEAPARIHQLRVGLRRLRTALRELAPLDPRLQPEWEVPLRQAFALLGQRRDDDGDGAAALVRPLLEAADAPKCRWSETAAVDLIATARAPALQAVLLRLIACVERVTPQPSLTPHDLKAWLVRRLQGLWRGVCRDGRRFARLPADQQHGVRKRLKRLRYLAEFSAPLWGTKAALRFTQRLAPVQDALGDCSDHRLALARFRADALTDPRSLFAVGFLQARLPALARRAQRQLRRLAERPAFWQRR